MYFTNKVLFQYMYVGVIVFGVIIGGCGQAFEGVFGFAPFSPPVVGGTTTQPVIAGTTTVVPVAQTFSQTAALLNISTVSVINPNGGITIQVDNTTGTRTATISGSKSTAAVTTSDNTTNELAQIQILAYPIPQDPTVFQIQAVFPVITQLSTDRVDFVITLPQTADLDLCSHNGDINVDNNTGAVRARSTNGRITITNSVGDVDASTTNRELILTNVQGNVAAQTSNAKITSQIILPTNGVVNLATSNAEINLAVPFTTAASLILIANNGTINANLTGFGAINPLITPTTVTGRLGLGGGLIIATTSDANINFQGGILAP